MANGINIDINDNLIIEVRDSLTNNLVTGASIQLTGSDDDGIFVGSEYNIVQSNASAITIDATASNYAPGNTVVNHGGSGFYETVTILLVKITLDFDCEIITLNESANDLDGKLSTSEDTTIKIKFDPLVPVIADPNDFRVILRQWFQTATGDVTYEYLEADIVKANEGNAIIGTVTITPDQVAERGDVLSARIIAL